MLTEQKATLVALDLSRTSIGPESLGTVAQVGTPQSECFTQDLTGMPPPPSRPPQVQGLVLEELCLHGCKELTDYAVEALVRHQPNLQSLDVSGCPELSSRSVEAAARSLKRLARLSLSANWRIREKGPPRRGHPGAVGPGGSF